MPSNRFIGLAVLGILGAALTGFFASLVSGDPIPDESWMVLVTARMAAGERLYQDVFCGVTPLAFQFQWAVQSLFGAGIAVLRGVDFALYAANLLLTLATGRLLRFSKIQLTLLVTATLVWIAPVNNSTYSHWSLLFALSSQFCAIRLLRSPRSLRWSAAAGAFAGLAFAAKQNTGLLCLAALAGGLLVARPRKVDRALPSAFGAFLLAAAVPLLPTAITGGLPDLFRMGFLNKTVYLESASLRYLDFVRWMPFDFWRTSGVSAGTLFWSQSLLYFAPFALLTALLMGRRLFQPRLTFLRLQLVFAAAALAFVFPRPDRIHMALCAPIVVLALVSLLRLGLPGSPVQRLIACAFSLLALLQISIWGRQIAHPLPARTDLPAFQSLRLTPGFAASIETAAAELSALRLEQGIFLLHPHAATIYLASGVQNPTPHDFPLRSAFGASGQRAMIDRIQSGTISAVCYSDRDWNSSSIWQPFPPAELVEFVRAEMRPGPSLSVCRLYFPRNDLAR